MEKEKLFNLQLTIQRLEEELSLYRNGTTAEDMFEVIKEKEADIATLATKLENKDEMIRKLAKSSGDVLNKYDALLIEKSRIENELAKFVERCTETENKVQAIISENVQRTQVYEQKCEDLKFRLSAAEDLNSVLKGSIAAKESAIVDLSQTVLKYEHELATNKANEELLATLRRTVSDKDATIQHLKESLEDSDRSVEKLQKRCADLLSDKASKISQLDAERSEMMGHVCKFKETMAQNTAQLQETLRRKELKNDELNTLISSLRGELRAKADKVQEAVAERDAHWQARVSDKDTRIHEVERTSRQLRDASERATAASASLKSENEALKLRVMEEAEEKLHLEQRRGRAALKERTNTIHYDPSDIAGVVKPKAVHSYNYGDTTAFDSLSLRSRGGASTKTASGFSLYSDDSRQL